MTGGTDRPTGAGRETAGQGEPGQAGIRLHGLGGNAAPPPLVNGWRWLLGFPKPAGDAFWSLLRAALLEPPVPDLQQRVEAFCEEHALPEEQVVGAVQACVMLLRQASALDLDRERFGQDLAALSAGERDESAILLGKYDEVKGEIRQRMVGETLIDHGKVLVGLDWRVDNLVSSDRGVALNATVVFLTLRYRDGDRMERVTLQLTPDALKELKQFTERIAG